MHFARVSVLQICYSILYIANYFKQCKAIDFAIL